MGLGLSSCLLKAGATLHLHVRSLEARDALRAEGLTRTGIFGELRAPAGSFTVSADPGDLVAASPELVLVCTKATSRDEVADTLAALWPDLASPIVVSCANGWGSAERLAVGIPKARIFNATVTTGFRREGPTRVEVTVHGDTMHVGSRFGASASEIEPLCTTLTEGGIPCEPSEQMDEDLWAKLLYNCALNPLAALLGVPYGALAESPERRAILEAVVREIFAVLEASGRRTHWPDADAYLAFFFADLLPPTRSHESSMLQDLRAGRPTEIDALCGAISQLGRESGVAVPVNDALAMLVRSLRR